MTDWRKQLQRLDGAYSEHTLSSYQSDFGLFAQWCRRHRTLSWLRLSEQFSAKDKWRSTGLVRLEGAGWMRRREGVARA